MNSSVAFWMKNVRRLWIPIVLFGVTLFLDHLFTQSGIRAGTGEEGNVVVVWLWENVALGPAALMIVWFVLLTTVAIFIARYSVFMASWVLYGGFIGHLIGFLSWTPVLRPFVWWTWDVGGSFGGLGIQAIFWVGVGFVLATLQKRFQKA